MGHQFLIIRVFIQGAKDKKENEKSLIFNSPLVVSL